MSAAFLFALFGLTFADQWCGLPELQFFQHDFVIDFF